MRRDHQAAMPGIHGGATGHDQVPFLHVAVTGAKLRIDMKETSAAPTVINDAYRRSVNRPCGPVRSLMNISLNVRPSLTGVSPKPVPNSTEMGSPL